MKVGVVTTSYPRWPGDPAGSFVAGFARWLAAQGHQVQVLAAGPGGASDGPIPVTRIGAGAGLFYGEGAPERLERSTLARLRAPVFAAALAAAVRRHSSGWDAVASHWLAPSGLAVALAAPRLPHLAIAHSADVHLLSRSGLADAAAWTLARTRACPVFVAEHLRTRFLAAVRSGATRSLLEKRSTVCPMGIDAVALTAARSGDHASARRELGLPPEGPLVAALGRLVPVKGLPVLLEAMRELPGHTLAVAGAGPERAALEVRARELGLEAHFLGEVQGTRRDALLAAADVLTVPSVPRPTGRTEGTPVVVLEALAAGLPLVASEIGGIIDVAGDVALLVPPGCPASLARAIAEVRSDPTAAAGRVASGRARAAAWDWSTLGPRLFTHLSLH